MKWTKLALTTMALACFAACDEPPPPELDSDVASELMRSFYSSAFELDGNAKKSTALDDWDSLSSNSTAFTEIVKDDGKVTIFTGGNSKDTLDIDNWRHTTGSVPDKNNITNAYAAAYGDVIYFGADRFATSGDAFLGFWFFQEAVVAAQNTGKFTGKHVQGDLLVLVNFQQGGSVPVIQVLEWHEEAPNLRVLFEDNAAKCEPTDEDQQVCAITNDMVIDSPWAYAPKSGPADKFAPGAFFEGGINLAEMFKDRPNLPCFASFMAETRASTSVTATLKDFVIRSFQQCEAGMTLEAHCKPATLELVGGRISIVVEYSGRVCNTSTGPADDLTGVSVSASDGTPLPLTHEVTDEEVTSLAGSACATFSEKFEPESLDSTSPGSVIFPVTVSAEAIGFDGGMITKGVDLACPLCP